MELRNSSNTWLHCEQASVRATSMACTAPFPRSRMPASIEISIVLVVSLLLERKT
jgi:hypothetical protein